MNLSLFLLSYFGLLLGMARARCMARRVARARYIAWTRAARARYMVTTRVANAKYMARSRAAKARYNTRLELLGPGIGSGP